MSQCNRSVEVGATAGTDLGASATLLDGDCLDVLKTLAENSVDSVVCDPPYGIAFMGRGWDKFGTPIGFQNWTTAWARETFRVLKPGGHLLAFGGSRLYHRLASGIEDAGFEVRDQLLWLYATGFPKSGNLKPAHEPIVMARKPMIGSRNANVELWGTGALDIEGCRIGFTDDAVIDVTSPNLPGRYPTNVVLTDPVLDGDYPEEVVGGGISAPGVWGGSNATANPERMFCGSKDKASYRSVASVEESGPLGKSRYFMLPKASRKDRDGGIAADCRAAVTLQAKSQNTHPTVKPTEVMRHLVRLITPARGMCLDPFAGSGSTGVACAIEGRSFIGIERDPHYVAIARARLGIADEQAA